MTALLVALAAGVGSVVRHVVATRVRGARGTLAVNVAGSLLAGVVVGADLGGATEVVVVTGLAGGLTTLSTWAVEVLALHREGRTRVAAGYAVGTLLLCAAAAWVGLRLG